VTKQERKVKEGAAPFLEPGEEVVTAVVARPRGFTQAHAGSLLLGSKQQAKAGAGAEQAGLRLASPMAVAVTQRRLLTLKIGSPIGLGIGGSVKALLSAVPIADVDSVEVKRLAAGKVLKLGVRGAEVKLEVNAMTDANGVAEAVNRTKAVAAASSSA
jgi:hypothetical protein